MRQPKNAMEIFKLLDKSNCRLCHESTCLAFAAAVYKGEKRLSLCPRVKPEMVEQYEQPAKQPDAAQASLQDGLAQLKELMASIDLKAAAARLGGRIERDRLVIKVLGKDFCVDARGNVSSDIHIHSWLISPFLNYIKYSQGIAPAGDWVPLRELERGKDWDRFFVHRCEKPMKMVADQYTDLFADMISIFNGKQVQNHYTSDISLVLMPFPNLPVLICYWKPEDGLESSLNIFFDTTAEKNLPVESIYLLVTGLVRMFEKIALRHG